MIVRRNATNRFVAKPAIYVLEISDRPILAFEAASTREAREVAREPWLRADLIRLRSNAKPLWDGKARLVTGPAAGEHLIEVKAALEAAKAGEDIAIVYLVQLDR
jgi:hypothetical protein